MKKFKSTLPKGNQNYILTLALPAPLTSLRKKYTPNATGTIITINGTISATTPNIVPADKPVVLFVKALITPSIEKIPPF